MMNINKLKKIKILYIAAGILFACAFFAGCSDSAPELSPMPALDTSLNATVPEISDTEEVVEAEQGTTIDIELIDPVQELTNRGSNTENNGIAAQYEDTIYFISDGLNSMPQSGKHEEKLLEQTDILYVSAYDSYIYFVCSEDYTVCRLSLEQEKAPEELNISGAYSMMIIQDHIYYQNAVGQDADSYIYRTNLDGFEKENLMIKASSYSTDGQVIYYANEQEENTLYSFDTCTGDNLQMSNNQASQINVIDGKVYYINKTTKNLTALDTNTLESTIVFEERILYLNSTDDLLVFYSKENGQLGTMKPDGSDVNFILEYNDVNGLNVVGDWIFFESYENTSSEEIFYIKTDGTQLSRELPVMTLAKVVNYNAESKTVYLDYVRYYTGEEAISEYIHDNSVSERRAQEILEEEGGVYIQNNNPNIIEYRLSDVTDITLNINEDSSYSTDGYSTDISHFEQIFDKDNNLILDQLYNITGFEGTLIKIEQFYNP